MCFGKIKVNGGNFSLPHHSSAHTYTHLRLASCKEGGNGGEGGYGELKFDGYRVSVRDDKKSGEMNVGNGFITL